MSYEISEKTKKHLAELFGVTYEELINMNHDEMEELVEKKTGKKITWPDRKIDGLEPQTLEEVDDDWER